MTIEIILKPNRKEVDIPAIMSLRKLRKDYMGHAKEMLLSFNETSLTQVIIVSKEDMYVSNETNLKIMANTWNERLKEEKIPLELVEINCQRTKFAAPPNPGGIVLHKFS